MNRHVGSHGRGVVAVLLAIALLIAVGGPASAASRRQPPSAGAVPTRDTMFVPRRMDLSRAPDATGGPLQLHRHALQPPELAATR